MREFTKMKRVEHITKTLQNSKNRFAERNSNIESGTHKHPPADGAVHSASVGPLAGGLVGGARDIVL